MFLRCLSILIYHRVIPDPDPLLPGVVCAEEFRRQIGVLSRWFNVLPLGEAVARLHSGTLPSRAACVTFDDGYADNVTVALPILRRQGVPATFFIATGFLDSGRMWNDSVIEAVRRMQGNEIDARHLGLDTLPIMTDEQRRSAIAALLAALKYLPQQERQRRVDALSAECGYPLPDDLMMTTDQVRELHGAGMEIGAHTVTHPILAKLSPAGARAEIEDGRDRLKDIIRAPVRLFAYPNGKPGQDYLREHVAMVKELGFAAAVSTSWGVARPGSDAYQLPRFTPWERTPAKFLARLIANAFRIERAPANCTVGRGLST